MLRLTRTVQPDEYISACISALSRRVSRRISRRISRRACRFFASVSSATGLSDSFTFGPTRTTYDDPLPYEAAGCHIRKVDLHLRRILPPLVIDEPAAVVVLRARYDLSRDLSRDLGEYLGEYLGGYLGGCLGAPVSIS